MLRDGVHQRLQKRRLNSTNGLQLSGRRKGVEVHGGTAGLILRIIGK